MTVQLDVTGWHWLNLWLVICLNCHGWRQKTSSGHSPQRSALVASLEMTGSLWDLTGISGISVLAVVTLFIVAFAYFEQIAFLIYCLDYLISWLSHMFDTLCNYPLLHTISCCLIMHVAHSVHTLSGLSQQEVFCYSDTGDHIIHMHC